MVSGATLQLVMRGGTMEPLSARPFSYLRVALVCGAIASWYDYSRRVAMEDVMRAEQRQQYYRRVKAMNANVRFGEEDEITNLTEYLAGKTTRF